jgi:cation diffusion facilitator family transporter
VSLRRSSAALRSDTQSENARTIGIALGANLVIAGAKLAAGLMTGSVAMFAETAHSLADSSNEVLLAVSLHRSRRPADADHPLGHGRERFLWAFMAAIASFLIGGCLSVGLGIYHIITGGTAGDFLAAGIVLGIAFVADGTSWLQGLRQARREARERGRGIWRHILRSSDPVLRAIVVEDTAALAGVLLAAVGLLVSELSGSSVPDAVASVLIGILLAVTAFGLALPLAEYLIGRSLSSARLQELYETLAAAPAVDEVLSLQAVYTGPEEAIVAAKVHPAAGLSIDQLTRAMDDLDLALRSAVPQVAEVYLDVTTFRSDELPLDRGRG